MSFHSLKFTTLIVIKKLSHSVKEFLKIFMLDLNVNFKNNYEYNSPDKHRKLLYFVPWYQNNVQYKLENLSRRHMPFSYNIQFFHLILNVLKCYCIFQEFKFRGSFLLGSFNILLKFKKTREHLFYKLLQTTLYKQSTCSIYQGLFYGLIGNYF